MVGSRPCAAGHACIDCRIQGGCSLRGSGEGWTSDVVTCVGRSKLPRVTVSYLRIFVSSYLRIFVFVSSYLRIFVSSYLRHLLCLDELLQQQTFFGLLRANGCRHATVPLNQGSLTPLHYPLCSRTVLLKGSLLAFPAQTESRRDGEQQLCWKSMVAVPAAPAPLTDSPRSI